MKMPKVSTKELKKFFEYIRSMPCEICKQGNWVWGIGWKNTVSHVLKKGSTRRNEHYDNCLSMCLPCHLVYEDKSKAFKLQFLIRAREVTKEFKNKMKIK